MYVAESALRCDRGERLTKSQEDGVEGDIYLRLMRDNHQLARIHTTALKPSPFDPSTAASLYGRDTCRRR